ncbi:MAG: transposase [Mesorhizobium sp.]|nr:MAG: transposase [Mesorhizobium sp.]
MLLFRWFVGISLDDPAWDHSVFSKIRGRLLVGDMLRFWPSKSEG